MEKHAKRCYGKNVLIAGCGGGCDCFGGMLFGHQLESVANKVIYSNLSFSSNHQLCRVSTPDVSPANKKGMCWAVQPTVDSDDLPSAVYFPEARMASYTNRIVYTIPKDQTVGEIREAYRCIFEAEGIVPDVVILVDGGSDVLMSGTETGLATPVEDMMNLKAVMGLDEVPDKFIQAIGTTVDVAHGIVPEELDARLKALEESGAMLWSHYFTDKHPAAQYFIQGVDKCNPVNTIVQSLTIAAMQGHRGGYTPPHLVPRIGRSKINLSEQTATLFCFDMKAVADEVVYLPLLDDNTNIFSMVKVLNKYRDSIGKD